MASVSQEVTKSQNTLRDSVTGRKTIEAHAKRFEQSEIEAVYLELVRVVHSPIYQKQGTFVGAGSRGKISSPAIFFFHARDTCNAVSKTAGRSQGVKYSLKSVALYGIEDSQSRPSEKSFFPVYDIRRAKTIRA